jgi:protein gp37
VYAVWNDLYHEDVSFEFIAKALQTAYKTPYHTYLALTKRVHKLQLFHEWASRHICYFAWPVNWWHGLTICNQQEADEKIPVFLRVPGKKFLSIEPMLALTIPQLVSSPWCDDCRGTGYYGDRGPGIGGNVEYIACDCRRKRKINAVICGGETGPKARSLHPDWVRSVRDQCAAAGVPFFLKYLNKKEGRILDGRVHDDLPWGRTYENLDSPAVGNTIANRSYLHGHHRQVSHNHYQVFKGEEMITEKMVEFRLKSLNGRLIPISSEYYLVDVAFLLGRLEEMNAEHAKEIKRLQNLLLCPVCSGVLPHPSGISCICGGSGNLIDAYDRLREEIEWLRGYK